VFQEVFKIIKMAWTQDSIEHNSEYYSIPQPYEEGIRRWPVAEWTRTYGAPGEVDEEGVIRRISVIPKPYQQPHPPFWQPFSVSENTIRWCAKEDILPWILISYPEKFASFCELYQSEASAVGRNLRLGQGVGAVRDISIGRTYEEAFEQGVKSTGFGFYTYFGEFGFTEAFRNPGEDAPVPLTLPTPEAVYQRMVDHDFALCGTVDDVKRKIESIAKCYGNGELEWFSWLLPQGMLPFDEVQRQLEIFATQIMPEFAD
jgi:alkanesulfonate monooxygenase SsuD/methylene tetrahydromethanopterin reductase-like flavin-dependent oxidoreductase (luciferase family)